ncbi:MAG: hypothetical protein HXK19_03975 [Alloprevotella tannerae]|nr:hypothetical protein [Alloprevotella tannerae]
MSGKITRSQEQLQIPAVHFIQNKNNILGHSMQRHVEHGKFVCEKDILLHDDFIDSEPPNPCPMETFLQRQHARFLQLVQIASGYHPIKHP